jgi:hypothetical protein
MLYSLMGKMRRPFTGSDLLSRGALEGMFDGILFYHHKSCEFEPRPWQGVLDATLSDNVCQ